MKQKLINILYAFPIQLIVLHFKKNVLMMSFWAILLLFITGGIGKTFGLKYLFLDPEYLHQVDFWSFFFIGLAFAGFVTSWNVSTYLLHSTRFPFIASLHRPFIQFSVNNSLLPIIFIGFYFYKIIDFQSNNNCETSMIFNYIGGFIVGYCNSLLIFIIYFRMTNRDIFSYDIKQRYKTPKFLRGLVRQRNKIQERETVERNKWRVDFYINGKLNIKRVRSVAHYNQTTLTEIFNQHHKNATVLQLITIVALIGLGTLMDVEAFRIPAGASVLILFAMLTSVLGALWYWLQGWHVFAILGLLVVINSITISYHGKYRNKAYGMTYNEQRANYNDAELPKIQGAKMIQQDIDSTLVILNNWRAKFGEEKPKLVMIGVSGGGLRASVWSMRVLQHTNEALNGKLMNQTTLMTGASGGMLGAAYYRALYYEALQKNINDLADKKHAEEVAKDLQNAVLFSIAVNDLFVPWSSFKDKNEKYPKDRGYIFEHQWNENTGYLLDKRLVDFRQMETKGDVPMMLITPSITNDGKRLIISPQGISYLTCPKIAHQNPQSRQYDGIDFRRMFQHQNAENLRFNSALRMNATYPYILPNVHLPSSPPIEVVDAGWRDNVGMDLPVRFAHVFKDWIEENTSGIVFVQIRAYADEDSTEMTSNQGIIQSLINPLGLAGQFMDMQDFHQDAILNYIQDIYGKGKIDVVHFMYRPSQLTEKASMSFHLTNKEKEDIIKAIDLPENQASLKHLKKLIH